MNKVTLLGSVTFVLVVMCGAATLGQGNATLSGEVKDDAGKGMPGVLVKAKIGGMTLTVPSELDGHFKINGLRPGTYEVRAERRGFVAPPQRVKVPAAESLRFTLEPGPIDRFNLSTRDLERVLPDSPYKQTVLSCEGCHSWGPLASRRAYRLENWMAGIKLMRTRGYAAGRFTDADVSKMAEYLQANFGPEAKLPLHLLPPDPIDERGLNIKYVTFDIPSRNAMPHTAVPDGKGSVWFTEYGAGKIGVVNVKTGQMEEFVPPSPIPPSPHGIALDAFGFIWFTEQTAGKLGRFDPRTRTFTEYPVPRPLSQPWRPDEVVPVGEGPHTPRL